MTTELTPARHRLDGKRIVVTGCSSGIGAATARLVAAEGAEVIGVDVRPPGESASHVGEFVRCDLADPSSIHEAAAAIGGAIDGLCNVAGVAGDRDADLVFRINVAGLRELTEELLPALRPGGAVVHVASTAGSPWHQRLDEHLELLATDGYEELCARLAAKGMDGAAAYDFGKETVVVYTMLRARARFAADGIRMNAVSPGPVETPILPDFLGTMDRELLLAFEEVAGRNGKPEEIAEAVVFLLTEDARWINGANLVVDGGGDAAWLTGGLPIAAKMW